MAKKQASLHLPLEILAQVDDLEGSFGESRSEIVTYILRAWFSKNQQEIRDTKSRIEALSSRIQELSKAKDSE